MVNGKFHALNERSKTFTLMVETGYGPDGGGTVIPAAMP